LSVFCWAGAEAEIERIKLTLRTRISFLAFIFSLLFGKRRGSYLPSSLQKSVKLDALKSSRAVQAGEERKEAKFEELRELREEGV